METVTGARRGRFVEVRATPSHESHLSETPTACSNCFSGRLLISPLTPALKLSGAP
jgi:hypothetical protein